MSDCTRRLHERRAVHEVSNARGFCLDYIGATE